MAHRLTVHDAAGATRSFFYETGPSRERSVSEIKLALEADILSGPRAGETAILEFLGTFDLVRELGTVEALREKVDGAVHFAWRLAGDLPIEEAFQSLRGFTDDLRFFGNSFANRFAADRGDDRLFGFGGDDRLNGWRGDDRLSGGDGDDHLRGGRGRDVLRGDVGDDTFVFRSAAEAGRDERRDRIADFESGADSIDLSRIDADEGATGRQDFTWIGGDDFSGAAGELAYRPGLLSGDTDGDGVADFEIRLAAKPVLVLDDLTL